MLPALSVATPAGREKVAEAPVPSAPPDTAAVPASVVTTAAVVILRIVLFDESATYTLPTLSTATPYGASKLAAAPVPSALPTTPSVPASVVTTPAGVTWRMASLSLSATYTFPALSTATPSGRSKLAAGPVASALPTTPAVPASVVTTPAGVILRIVLFPSSATYTFPALSTAAPNGSLKLAAAPVPSALPVTPAVPASVVTTPVEVTLRIVAFTESTT